MPKLPASFFAGNRKTLTEKGGVYVLSAYTGMQRGNDAAFKFQQEANFWYLTGIDSPDWWVIIDGSRHKTWLVAPEVSESHQIFDGSLQLADAIRISGADDVISLDDADGLLRELARKHSLVYALGDDPYAKYYNFVVNPAQKTLWRKLERIFNDVEDVRKDLAKLRAIKQPDEIRAIRRAIALTIKGFERTRLNMGAYKHEYEIEADFSHEFRREAADHAYDPIVAAGGHAVTLHYCENSGTIKSREMVLLDVGARVDGYAADITRTYAANPTNRHIQLHSAVEKAHNRIIKLLGPSLPVSEYLAAVEEIMKDALEEVDLIKDRVDNETYRKYFPHAISHGLGIDVHDSLGETRYFMPGMVLTVEPGIYIPEERIGVRIEDDILITDNGAENLSRRLPTDLSYGHAEVKRV